MGSLTCRPSMSPSMRGVYFFMYALSNDNTAPMNTVTNNIQP